MEINLNSKRVTLKTAKKYCPEDISLNVSLQDKAVAPATTEQAVSADTGYAGLGTVTVAPVATESGAATPSAAAQVITPSEGKLFDKFTVNATPTEQKTIDANGTFTPSTGKFFDSVTVNVNTAKPEQEKNVDLTTMTPVEVTPDEGYTLSKVTATPKAPLANTADANAAAGDILSGKTAYVNGAKVTGTIALADTTATPTLNAQELTPPAGTYYKKVTVAATPLDDVGSVVAGTTGVTTVFPTAGKLGIQGLIVHPTPSQTKSAVPSTDAQTITPDAGKFLSSVEIAATPLDDSKAVTANTIPMIVRPSEGKLGLKSVAINPTPSGSKTATANGTVTPDSGKLLSSVTVDVPPYAQDVATTAAMNANLVAANVGKIYRFTGTTDDSYTNGDLYIVEG